MCIYKITPYFVYNAKYDAKRCTSIDYMKAKLLIGIEKLHACVYVWPLYAVLRFINRLKDTPVELNQAG